MERYDLNAVPNASSEKAGVLRVANEVDEKNSGCTDAAITPGNLYSLLDCRKANTSYKASDVVACPYHTEFLLKCVTAGSTAAGSLDTTNVTKGQVITDGDAKWEVIAKAIIDASISGKVITVTFIDGTQKTLTTQDTVGSTVSITAGTLSNGGTIPLPSGYTRAQCKYAVWSHEYANASERNNGYGMYGLRVQVNQDTGVVTASSRNYSPDDGQKWNSSSLTVGYLCIAVK